MGTVKSKVADVQETFSEGETRASSLRMYCVSLWGLVGLGRVKTQGQA